MNNKVEFTKKWDLPKSAIYQDAKHAKMTTKTLVFIFHILFAIHGAGNDSMVYTPHFVLNIRKNRIEKKP